MSSVDREKHLALMNFAIEGAKTGRCAGLQKFFQAIEDPKIRQQINSWLHKYSPISMVLLGKRAGSFQVSADKSKTFAESEAMANPYWTICPPVRAVVVTTVTPRIRKDKTSDIEISRAQARAAFNRFLANPSHSNRSNVEGLMLEYSLTYEQAPTNRTFAPVLQGGLPSLGRRR